MAIIPAKVGIHLALIHPWNWIPAFAGMTALVASSCSGDEARYIQPNTAVPALTYVPHPGKLEIEVSGTYEFEAGDRAAAMDESQLLDTQRAFDSVAADYDGPRGNNELIQRMRVTLWNTVRKNLQPGSRLLDLGCGTGIDAIEFATRGYRVVASDWSPRMVERTHARAAAAGVEAQVAAVHVGVHQLDQLDGKFDGIYSNFGPLNCAPDLGEVATQCARLLRPGGKLVFSVIGRICPWEVGYYLFKGRAKRALVRAARGATAVGMNRHTIWTKYYLPREFYRDFESHFALDDYRALSLFMPPPYLVDFYQRHRAGCERLGRLDDRMGALPLLRDMGDHFLIVMHRR